MDDSTVKPASEPAAKMVMWRTHRYDSQIARVECTRATEKSVWVLERPWTMSGKPKAPVERRRDRVSSYDRFHDTWEEAHAYLLQRAADRLEVARRDLQEAQSEYGNIRGMKKPEGA